MRVKLIPSFQKRKAWGFSILVCGLVACAQTQTPTPAPRLTPATRVSTATLPPTAVPSPTAFPATPTTVPPTATAVAFLRDDAGRILGGAAPLLNYAPDQITSQPCKRVVKWSLKSIQIPNSSSVGVADEPCVIQNIIDDFAFASGFDPTWLSPDAMRDAIDLYKTDPALSKVYSAFWVDNFIAGGKYVQSVPRAVCDKPVYRLLNVARPIPTINSNAFVVQVNYIVVAHGFAPFRCDFVDFGLGQPFPKRTPVVVTAESMRTPSAYPVWLAVAMWNAETQRWQFQGSGPLTTFVDAQRVAQLYEAAEVKPW